jgi:hypothetical protein
VRSIDIAEKCKVMFMEGHIQAKKKKKKTTKTKPTG